MSFTIREAVSEAEWQQIVELLRSVYVGQGYSVVSWADLTLHRAVLEPEGVGLVAVEEHGTVLGFTLLLHPESTMRQLAGSNEREFRLLAVTDVARGQGVGQALIQACIDRSRGAGANALVLWTQPTMVAAQRLYQRLGFARMADRDQPDERGFSRMVFGLGLK